MSLFRPARAPFIEAPSRKRRGGAFVEGGILVGLIAVVAIGSVSTLGQATNKSLCGVSETLGSFFSIEGAGCAAEGDRPGGGAVAGDQDADADPDTDPTSDPIAIGLPSFASMSDVEPNTVFFTAPAAISGDATEMLFILGGSYSIDGEPFTSVGREIDGGQILALSLTTGANFSTMYSVTAQAGGSSSVFSVTTRAASATPTNFVDFAPLFDLDPSTAADSDIQTIAGLEVTAPVSLIQPSSGLAEFRVMDPTGADLHDWSAASATVPVGGQVQVRVITSETYGAPHTATLRVGGVEGSFTATNRAAESTPTNFVDFAPQYDVGLSAAVDSGIQSIAGLEIEALASLGQPSVGSAEFRVMGSTGSVLRDWSSDATMVPVGGQVEVRMITADAFEAAHSATLTVGGVQRTFEVVTRAADVTPDFFGFAAAEPQDDNVVVTSATVTPVGYIDPAPISVSGSGAAYSIDGGAFISTPGIILPGQTVSVRGVSSSLWGDTEVIALTIGALAPATFEIPTREANTDPDSFANFTTQTGAQPSTTITSNTQALTGIEGDTFVSISGASGRFSHQGGAFGDSRFISPSGDIGGDLIQVRLTTGSAFNTTYMTTVTVGSSSSTFSVKTRAASTTPAAFAFTAQTGVAPNAVISSNAVTLTGLEANGSATVSGAGAPQIQTRTSADVIQTAWTTGAAVVPVGGKIEVRQTSAATGTTLRAATVTIGTRSATFNATTRALDTTPNTFTFTDQTGRTLSTLYTSNTLTLSGLLDAAPISVSSSGSFSVNGAAYRTTATTISNGDTVALRRTTGAAYATNTDTTLTIGGVSDTWRLTTRAAVTAPTNFANFTAATNINSGTVANSNVQTLSGLEAATTASISGGSTAQFQVFNSAGTVVRSFSAASTTVPVGGKVQVRQTASATYGATATSTLTVGGVARTYSVTTRAAVVVPTNFVNFNTTSGHNRSTIITSNTQTLAGLEAAANGSISGNSGTFSVNGGTFSATARTIPVGANVRVQLKTGSAYNTTYTTTMTIGGVARTFSAKTDTAPPVLTVTNAVSSVTGSGWRMATYSGSSGVGPYTFSITSPTTQTYFSLVAVTGGVELRSRNVDAACSPIRVFSGTITVKITDSKGNIDTDARSFSVWERQLWGQSNC